MSSDHQERARVRSRIGSLILEFCRQHDRFFMGELTTYVQIRVKAAPDSPGRVLRELRRDGLVRVLLVSRSRSLYKVIRTAEQIQMFQAEAS